MTRFTANLDDSLPRIAVDLGYSAMSRSTGIAFSHNGQVQAQSFGEAVQNIRSHLIATGPHLLILEAVLSTYHAPNGNPAIRGEFEKGRGWYHGPGVTTFAAALRLLQELDRSLPAGLGPIPIVEGFLSYKPTKVSHEVDALRLLDEYSSAERFRPLRGSQPICSCLDDVPEVRRYNKPPPCKSK